MNILVDNQHFQAFSWLVSADDSPACFPSWLGTLADCLLQQCHNSGLLSHFANIQPYGHSHYKKSRHENSGCFTLRVLIIPETCKSWRNREVSGRTAHAQFTRSTIPSMLFGSRESRAKGDQRDVNKQWTMMQIYSIVLTRNSDMATRTFNCRALKEERMRKSRE